MNTLTELDEYFTTLKQMRETENPEEKERLRLKLEEYLKQEL